jgi:hypothetical protein
MNEQLDRRAFLQQSGLAALSVAVTSGQAAKADETAKHTNPLAGLPSKPAAHLEKIKALKDNEWLNLGVPAADPKWGTARGRSWSSKMSYAPDLQGAFLVGQGQHGYIKPDGLFDDIFFFDLNGNRWICVFPGINTKTLVEDIKSGKFKVNQDGQLVNADGEPLFTGYCHHSYQSHTYAADLHRWIGVGGWNGFPYDQHCTKLDWHVEGAKLYQEQMKGKENRAAGMPFFYNTATGRFERYPFNQKMPGGVTDQVIYYLPSKKALWLFQTRNNQTWLGDFEARKWSDAGAKGRTPPGIDFGTCYDSKRDCIYVCGGSYRGPYGKDEGKIYVYDVKTNAWSNIPDKGTMAPIFASNYACVHYDSANDRLVNMVFSNEKRGVFVFDPNTGAWADEALSLPPGLKDSRGCGHGFYSPQVNAHFFYMAGDSQDNGTMWAYRYKRVTP